MPTELDLVGRVAVATLLGALIGLERELTDQSAGLRTHISVALGSALFAIVSAYSFGEFVGPRSASNYQVDVTRIASNIVTGVGFLGGGAIIKQGATVRGLTTAASMWVTAAVGMAVGLGSYLMAWFTTGALLLSLVGLRRPRRWLRSRGLAGKSSITVHLRPGADAGAVISALHHLDDAELRDLSVRTEADATVVRAELRGPDLNERLAEISQLDGVTQVATG
ncbi:MAG: MgtC/SapB family protein [Acidimicrobiales bacterium]